jgi:hypothetical protein
MERTKRRVGHVARGHQLVLETFVVCEDERVAGQLVLDPQPREPLVPEGQRVGARKPPDHAIRHAGARAAARGARVFEERHVRAR